VKGIITRLSAAQAASGIVNGIATPFFGAWLAWRGFSAGEIAVVLSAGLLLRIFVGPAAGIIADARNDRRGAMIFLYWVVFASYCAMALVGSRYVVATAAIVAPVASGVALPLLESVCVRLAGHYGYHYGKVRLWASSAFVLFNIVGGVCLWCFGTVAIAPLLALTSFLCIVTSTRLPSSPSLSHRVGGPLGLRKIVGETRELLCSPTFLLFLVAGSLAQGSHAFYYGYGGLHWRQLGYSGWLIGVIWPLGVFAEIAILRFSHRLQHMLKPGWFLFWGAAACTVRWAVMAFDPPLSVVIAAQFLHGFTFALSHLGAMFFILKAVPPRLAATAQSLYFMVYSGLVLGMATYASGMIYESFGGRAYLLMSAMGLLAMGFAVLLSRVWHGKSILRHGSTEFIDRI